MASLRIFALALICLLLAVAHGQTPEALSGNLDVEGHIWADLFSDGTTVITDGDITAESLVLSGSLEAGDATLGNLVATDLNTANLWAWDTSSNTLTSHMLRVEGDATFEDSLSVEGTLHAQMSSLGETRIEENLMVEGEANVQGLLFVHTNVQVTGDMNVGQTARLFGDVLANMTLTVEDMLTVNGHAWAEEWMVDGLSEVKDLTVHQDADLGYLWSQNLYINGTAEIDGDLYSMGSITVWGDVTAKQMRVDNYADVHGNATVDGWLDSQSASTSGDFHSLTWAHLNESVTVGGYAEVMTNVTVMEDAYVRGNITGEGSVMGVHGVFDTLDVDTSTIESLTSTFITAGTLEAHDASSVGTFVVTGMTTLDTLNVPGSTLLRETFMESLYSEVLGFGSITSASLSVSGHAILTSVEVKTMLTVGSPSETDNASFESAFADDFMMDELWADQGNIEEISGLLLDTLSLNGINAMISNLTSVWAGIEDLHSMMGTIDTIHGLWANITEINAMDTTATNFWAEQGALKDVYSESVYTQDITVMDGQVKRTHANETLATILSVVDGTVDYLHSMTSTIDTLTSTNATVETLVSEHGMVESIWGEELWYAKGTITDLTSQKHWTEAVKIRDGLDSEVVYANYANISHAEFMSLRVTDMAWIAEATVREDASVEGFTVLQEGFISGEAVLAALTVVGDSLLSTVSVTGPAFLTDLSVKKVTITDHFEAKASKLGDTTLDVLNVDGDATVGGFFETVGDSALGGNLVVTGTTQFQTGSFSRIGTAIITTTDMEAFNMDVANGLFGAITVDTLDVNRGANFQRSIDLAPLRSSTSGGSFSLYSSIAQTALTASYDGVSTPVAAATVLHTGDATVDALAFTSSTDHTEATLRVTGDGYVDFLGGGVQLDELLVDGGILFENENNVAWASASAVPTAVLSAGESKPFYVYDSLVDRDMSPPGSMYDPSRFEEPGLNDDLLTLNPGHYRVSGNVYFAFTAPATANSVLLTSAGVDGFDGSDSTGAQVYNTECVASFNSISGSFWGGSCFFDDVITVPAGGMVTLRTYASWRFSSASLANTLRVDPRSTILIEEFFERTSEGL